MLSVSKTSPVLARQTVGESSEQGPAWQLGRIRAAASSVEQVARLVV